MNETECRSCHAPIVWCQTSSGKLIPVDIVPVPNGNLGIVGFTETTAIVVTRSADAWREGENRYVSHFATCPQANKWRSKK